MPNPAYEDLEDVLAAVRAARAQLAQELKGVCTLMAQGVWTGPSAASRFVEDLQGRDRDLPRYFDQLVAAVEERMAQVPRTRVVQVQVW